jgi:hypothetical protein
MLYVFVEGHDDKRYFERIFGNYFGQYRFIEYARMRKDKVHNFINSINSAKEGDYLFFCDSDGKSIDEKKVELVSKYQQILSPGKTYIVCYEIESWYYAGINETVCRQMRLKDFKNNTDSLTKEEFNSKLPRLSDRSSIMIQMLDRYSLDLAATRNTSLMIFYKTIRKESA